MKTRANNYFLKKVTDNNIMLIISAIIIAIAISMIFISNSKADSSSEYEKAFITIEIGDGDTLTSIAEQYALSPSNYNDYIEEVKHINNLNNDTIHYGCYLLIPVYN